MSTGTSPVLGPRAVDPVDLSALQTEAVDPGYAAVDTASVHELVTLMNAADAQVPAAVAAVSDVLAKAVEGISERVRAGGRLVYVGAGTAGRLGVLDASEIPPTFGTDPELVQGHIAGGDQALRTAVEGAEDDRAAGAALIARLGIGPADAVVGIAASGRTPFVVAALESARAAGALTVGVACTSPSEIGRVADHAIEVLVGPEVIAGSTRLKAGTAQKLVLNIISTVTMVQVGKTYGNLMVDVQATNAKLTERATRIVERLARVDRPAASDALAAAEGNVKAAVVMARLGLTRAAALAALSAADGRLRVVLEGAQP